MHAWPLAVLALAVSACAVEPLPLPSSKPGLTESWRGSEVSFAYPRGWSRADWSGPSSFTYMVAAVSNQRLGDPCFRRGNGGGCGPPLRRLEPGALLVEWWVNSFPGWRLAAQPGAPTTVDRLPAKVIGGSQGALACSGLSAAAGITVSIASPGAPFNYYQFVSCMRGPGVAQERSLALAILRSGRFGSG